MEISDEARDEFIMCVCVRFVCLQDRHVVAVCVAVVALSTCSQAFPSAWSQWTGGHHHGPVVRATPAFVGESFFAPQEVPQEVPLEGNAVVQDNGQDSQDDGTYSFGYDVKDDNGGHSRQESRDSKGTVTGEFD